MRTPRPARRGDIITRQMFYELRDLAVSLQLVVDPASGIALEQTDSGTALWMEEADEFPAKLTARTGNNYAWTRQVDTAGGVWKNDPTATGTTTRDPAHEANGVAVDVATTPVVLLTRDPHSGRLHFDRNTCD